VSRLVNDTPKIAAYLKYVKYLFDLFEQVLIEAEEASVRRKMEAMSAVTASGWPSLLGGVCRALLKMAPGEERLMSMSLQRSQRPEFVYGLARRTRRSRWVPLSPCRGSG
jgi:hypothetical protein